MQHSAQTAKMTIHDTIWHTQRAMSNPKKQQQQQQTTKSTKPATTATTRASPAKATRHNKAKMHSGCSMLWIMMKKTIVHRKTHSTGAKKAD